MLQVDLNRLQREGRARIDVEVPPDAEFWTDIELEPRSPLEVQLDVQQAGPDVVVRGRVTGTFGRECRRCLEPVDVVVDEELARLYRSGDELEEGEPEDVLPLPTGATLDLREPVREQVLVGVPQYAYCREDCQGLCPQCGTNLNESSCECTVEEEDERWAPLRRLKSEG